MSYNLYRAVSLGTTLFLRTTQARTSSNQSTARAGRDLKPPQFHRWPWRGPLKQPRLPQVAAEASGPPRGHLRPYPNKPRAWPEQPRAFPSVPEPCPSGPGAVHGAEGNRPAAGTRPQGAAPSRSRPVPSPPTLLRDKQGSQENSDTQKRLIKLQ